MTIRVRLFARMAQEAGEALLVLELRAGARVGEVREAALRARPGLSWPAGTMLAVNQEYAQAQRELAEGDEVAVIPPVSGG